MISFALFSQACWAKNHLVLYKRSELRDAEHNASNMANFQLSFCRETDSHPSWPND